MDRFIAKIITSEFDEKLNLKSSMDRFIVRKSTKSGLLYLHLKSSMDRFIDFNALVC